jgi:NAD(P)-dependent dehydrogenase (short-subunit alcohol dehydrogenase family)
VDKTIERFSRLDVAVNNAGTEGQVGPITDQTAESYAATFDTNVLGVLLSMKHEVRVMQRQGSGNIINISSTYGHEGAAGASVYVGRKHAVEGITRSVALEVVNSGIRVNAVAPGPVDTGMLTRFTGSPENKAALASTKARAFVSFVEQYMGAMNSVSPTREAASAESVERAAEQDTQRGSHTASVAGGWCTEAPDRPQTPPTHVKHACHGLLQFRDALG